MQRSVFQDFDFVAVRIGDKGHFSRAGREFFPPAGWPDFNAGLFHLPAVVDDVIDAECGVHQVLGTGRRVVRGVAEFEERIIAGKDKEGEAVALGRVLELPQRVAEGFVERDRLFQVLDADTGVEKADHGGGNMGQILEIAKRDSRRFAFRGFGE